LQDIVPIDSVPFNPQLLVKTEKLKERKPVTTHVCWLFRFTLPWFCFPFSTWFSDLYL